MTVRRMAAAAGSVGLAVLVWWAAPFGLDLVGLDDFALIGRILATIAALSVLEAALARLR